MGKQTQENEVKGKYIAVDCGKYNTKVAAFAASNDNYTTFKFRTKISEGTFEDDMLEKGTFLVRYNGKTYKIGAGARQEAEMETSKKSEIHKICTLAAIARCVNTKDTENVNVVIGIPYQTCCVPEERNDYKNFIIPEGEHTVELKLSNKEEVISVTFRIVKRYVYPESIGVLYQYPAMLDEIVGIIDIGNLNINNTYCNKFSIIHESSFTDELGGQILISGLAQELTSELGSRCDDNLAASILLKPLNERYLSPKNGSDEIKEKSKSIITRYMKEHVLSIKRKCDTKHWPLDYMSLVVIGGTTKLLTNEIKEIFGENVFIPENPEYVNVEGFLKKMCQEFGINLFEILEKKESEIGTDTGNTGEK